MAKEKTDYIELLPFVEEKGLKVKCLYTANTNVASDWNLSKYVIINEHGRKYIVVNCDHVLIELE